MNKLFFIIGVGRSGTTLLQCMLNAHPEIGLPVETHFVRKYVVDEARGRMQRKISWDDIMNQFRVDTDLARLNIDIQGVLEPFINGKKSFTYKDMFLELLRIYSQRVEKEIIGEKDPANTPFLYEIYTAYPDAIIIHIIRDPRDVVLSRSKTYWGKNRSFWSHVLEYKRLLHKARKLGRLLFNEHYIEILYENLIANPRKELGVICEKLGISFHDDMLRYYEKAEEIVTEQEMEWKKNIFKPLLQNNTQNWRSGLEKWQIIVIEGACEEPFAELGYELSGFSKKFSRRFFLSLVYALEIIWRSKRLARRILVKSGT